MKKFLLTLSLLVSVSSFGAYVEGPRVKVEGGVGVGKADEVILPLNVAILPEWRSEIRHDINVAFGPKFTVVAGPQIKKMYYSGAKVRALIGAEVHVNFKITEKISGFVGAEAGIGGGSDVSSNGEKNAVFDGLGLVSGGIKVNERYNIGAYVGYGKGNFGIQAGYTF
ncbi:hypothetical protein STFE110948_05015 [Streptobacillus felis]|uniref:Outer membrane protein beta-barrel domain-containing protein n=1 Tax=Streptobacillus felis TaxID=1384509 RepID=A0A7Z0T8R0_9FUSO|nr:hypothetical protein [Streptobacillus felis]NYV28204.1 hypothetical protein [Streptobacillus felis]